MALLLAAERDSEAACPICKPFSPLPGQRRVQSSSSLPPAGLVEQLRLEERAVVSTCMHVFCQQCLWRWLDYKHTCPLCKGQMSSIFYRITETGEFLEKQLPPPPPEKPAEEPARLPLIDERRGRSSQLPDSYDEARRQRRLRRHNHQPLTEPRPYYHRVRAMMGAPGVRAAGGSAQQPQLEVEDAGVLWRRHIYLQGIRAEPLDLRRVGAPGPTAQKRLEAWVERELRAVLRHGDVSLLRSFVMGLALSAGLCGRTGGNPDPAAEEEAVHTLQPFLQAHARHFWHELRCFARQPFSMATYDRTVQYPAQDQQVSGAQGGADSSAAIGFSLWHAQSQGHHSSRSSSGFGVPAAAPQEDGSHLSASSSAAARMDQLEQEQSRAHKRRRATGASQLMSAQTEEALLAERRCILHGIGGSIGLCLDCAEQQALEQAEAVDRDPSPLRQQSQAGQADAMPVSRQNATAATSPDSRLTDSAAIGRLAAERLRALLGEADSATQSAADIAQGRREVADGASAAALSRSPIIDLCEGDSSDEGDVVFLSSSRAAVAADGSLAGSGTKPKPWLIRRNRFPVAAVQRTPT